MTLASLVWPLAGGLLIGMAAAAFLLWEGRVAGVSGLVAEASGISRASGRRAALLFVAGLVVGGALALWFRPTDLSALVDRPWALVIVAGLLVGYGTRLGSGCTSEHGICGLARLSRRSLVATLLFMATGALTVYLMRHVAGASA